MIHIIIAKLAEVQKIYFLIDLINLKMFSICYKCFFAVAKKEEKEVKKEAENNKEETKAPEKR